MAASAVHTPQILMLSGIGDPAELTPLNISVIVKSTKIGKNFQDHVLLTNQWAVAPEYTTLDPLMQNPGFFSTALDQWAQTKTGPLVLNPCTNIGWLRVNTSQPPFNTLPDPRYVCSIIAGEPTLRGRSQRRAYLLALRSPVRATLRRVWRCW
jgi:choline dehydrogenase-like flavoprotein